MLKSVDLEKAVKASKELFESLNLSVLEESAKIHAARNGLFMWIKIHMKNMIQLKIRI